MNIWSTIKQIFLIILFILTGDATALANQFDADLQRFVQPNSIGYSVIVTKEGKTLYQNAKGMANLELSVPLSTDTIFEIGSLTKQFTSVAILHLVQKGQLKLSDTLDQFIPGINTTKAPVTIEHLLAHTSGLVDPINNPEFLATRVQEKVTLEQLIEQFKNGNWQFVPGERISYSNVGYSFLAKVIESVSGLKYIDYLDKHFFTPLNMQSTDQASYAITVGKASGYTYQGDKPRQNDLLDLGWAYAAGDLLSTTTDLAKWSNALMQGKILNPTYLDKLLAKIKLNNGTEVNGSYNFSLVKIGEYDAIRMWGSTLGFSSHSIYVPEPDIYIVALSNADGVNGGGWIPPATVAAKFAATILDFPLPSYTPVSISTLQPKKYIGQYRLNETVVRKISFENGQFFYQRNDGPKYSVVPMGDDSFYFADTLSYFKIVGQDEKKASLDFYYFLNSEPESSLKIN